MEKLLDSISGFVDQKLKNPFINTFIITWFAFNWRPIVFFIFSKQTAETKIWFITNQYSSLKTSLFLPAVWTIGILVFIPIILFGVEYLLSYVKDYTRILQKNTKIKELKSQGVIAEEKNKIEDKVLAAKKIGNVNQHIADLNEKIKIYEDDITLERSKNLELVKKHSEETKIFNKELSLCKEEILKISEELYASENKFSAYEMMEKHIKSGLEQEKEELNAKLKSADENLGLQMNNYFKLGSKNSVLNFTISRMHNPVNKVLQFPDTRILEYFDNFHLKYFNLNTNQVLTIEQLYQKTNLKFSETTDLSVVQSAVNSYLHVQGLRGAD